MSINILNMLKEFDQSTYYSLDTMKHAIAHTVAGDALDCNDWQDIFYAETVQEIKEIVKCLIPKYTQLWNILYQPETAEEWAYNYYMKLKTIRKHNAQITKARATYIREWDDARKAFKMAGRSEYQISMDKLEA